METSSLKKFALQARRMLLEQVQNQLELVLQPDSRAQRDSQKAVAQLQKQIDLSSREQVIEQAAYTWFNRFCALRFMDANRYTRIGTVSPAEGFNQPEILAEAKQGHIEEELQIDRAQVMGLLDGTLPSNDPQQEAYRLLLVATCNQYHSLMPFLFEQIADYTELLMPDDLLSDNSILTQLRDVLTAEVCQDVEVIGWLYQFYISEKKDDLFAALKKGQKITPENIPAATQLFTPHWIVRYLVENSLGRLWMLNHPESSLIEQMDYYIKPEESETDFLQISSPEEIKICDPACGSGHMLTYAFDLLYAIYEEQGYPASDIPRLILTHNLYGVEIDQRAGALAAFALTMKAREKYRRFLQPDKAVQPNICVLENIQIDPEDLSVYMDKVGRDLFSDGLQGVVNQWEEADNFGSLIRPLVTDVTDALELLRERKLGEDLFLADVHQKVLKALKQADYLSPKYHVVVANPPYMGSKGMSPRTKEYVTKHYADVKRDLFSAFCVRLLELIVDAGLVGAMTPFNWMFLSSYENLRKHIFEEGTITSLVQPELHSFFDSAYVSVCAFTIAKSNLPSYEGVFIDLSEFYGADLQSPRALDAIRDPQCRWRYTANENDFKKLPGFPIVYACRSHIRDLFSQYPKLDEFITTREGMTTGDNDRFLRYWQEVPLSRIGFECQNESDAKASDAKWFPFIKGGEFRRWSGNHEFIVDWYNDGAEMKAFADPATGRIRSHNYNGDWAFRCGFTWSGISSGVFAVRTVDTGFMFDAKGPMGFATGEFSHHACSAFLNSSVVTKLIRLMAPTMDFKLGHVLNLPLNTRSLHDVEELAEHCQRISQADWNTQEIAWGFKAPSLLADENPPSIAESWTNKRARDTEKIALLRDLEQQNNQIFATDYGLQDNVEIEPQIHQVSLCCNPSYRYDSEKSEAELEALLLADTMREFISYAVGCMLGRYSLDKPGLILANQGETAEDYRQQIPEPTFAPDEDNVIPLLDGDWFEDDISSRFKAFLKITFGAEHFEENLTFLEDGLYPENKTGKKRKTIRDYFLKEFYNHHVKMYKKRPIYWLFSSPKGTFNALIYMHRYRPDTISVVLNDYLREFQNKLRNEIERLQSVADSATAGKSDKAEALKKVAQYKKDLKELEEYERDVLYPLASERIEIDLDDGVKVNYNKFGTALKKVTGLTGKA